MNLLEGRKVYINSGLRQSGTTDNFMIGIPITTDNDYEFVTCLSANIPVAYYLVPLGANTFVLTENGVNTTISIPVGNYTLKSFTIDVAALMILNSPNGYTYTIAYNVGYTNVLTGLMTFTCSNTTSNVSITVFNALNEQFGFPSNSTNTFTNGNITSDNITSFINETSIFLRSDLGDNGTDTILQECYCNTSQPLGIIIFQSTAPLEYGKRLIGGNPRTGRFWLTDEYNNPINLNGINFVFTLLFYRFKSDPGLEEIIDNLKRLNSNFETLIQMLTGQAQPQSQPQSGLAQPRPIVSNPELNPPGWASPVAEEKVIPTIPGNDNGQTPLTIIPINDNGQVGDDSTIEDQSIFKSPAVYI